MSAAHRSTPRVAVPLAALVAATAFGVGTPAHASGLSADASCDSSGNGHFVCVATVSGGTAPYAYTWTPVYNAVIRVGAHSSVVTGLCDVNHGSTLDLTVTDATGASTSTTGALDCTAIAP